MSEQETPYISNSWPNRDAASMNEFFGRVGENQVMLQTPYPLRLAWDNSIVINEFSCNEKVADSIYRVMIDVKDAYGLPEIRRLNIDLFGGCLNVRPMRGNSRGMSTHSWGAAIDWFPDKNQLHTPFNKAEFSKPEYVAFLNCWIKEGWNPLGVSWGKDSMHIEATKNYVALLPEPEIIYS